MLVDLKRNHALALAKHDWERCEEIHKELEEEGHKTHADLLYGFYQSYRKNERSLLKGQNTNQND